MDLDEFVGFAPVFLIPLAWLVTLLSDYGFVGVRSIQVMHLVMLVFLPLFLFKGWNRLNEGVLKTWRNVILAGFLFTLAGSAGVFLNLGASLTFFPELIYWAVVPSIATVYTAWKADWNAHLLFPGILGLIGGFIFTLSFFNGFFPTWLSVSMVGIGQGYSIFHAVNMD